MASGQRLYKTPVTRIENNEAPFSAEKGVHFCPGTSRGAEWKGVAHDPHTNLVFTGDVDWCTTVRLQPVAQLKAIAKGTFWSGNLNLNPLDLYGHFDPHTDWAGSLYATDADTGVWKWRAKSNYPILSGITPRARGVVFLRDMGGNFYALDVRNGARLWSKKIDGAIGGWGCHLSRRRAAKSGSRGWYDLPSLANRDNRCKIAVLGLMR
jgi:outer membrane protein assembly factor BamB